MAQQITKPRMNFIEVLIIIIGLPLCDRRSYDELQQLERPYHTGHSWNSER